MKSKAAIALAAGEPLVIDLVDLEGPKEGEVLVEVMASGVCHTDAYTLSAIEFTLRSARKKTRTHLAGTTERILMMRAQRDR